MKAKTGFTNKMPLRRFRTFVPNTARKPDIPVQADDITAATTNAVSPSDLPVSAMTKEELLSRAKQNIDSCETPLRAAAEDIALACDQGATQREVAAAVGKSPAWVNRLLKWRSSGYEGSAFGGNFVQGVNKKGAQTAPAVTETVLSPISWAESDGLPAQVPQTNISELDTTKTGVSEHVLPSDGGENFSEAGRPLTHKEAFDVSVQRRNLIKGLDLLGSARPGLRAQLALIVESRRAQLKLTWDQLIIPAHDFHVSSLTDQEPSS